MTFTPDEAKAFYDRFSAKQDSQGFYEDAALDALVRSADFGNAQRIFEFGCGTGRFAERLFTNELLSTAQYMGCDISPVMVKLARKRLSRYGTRAVIYEASEQLDFPLNNNSADRIVCTYVLDLLNDQNIRSFLGESHRVLGTDGCLCLVSLTNGTGIFSKIVSAFWNVIYRVRPSLVGGCRPIRLDKYIDDQYWKILSQEVVTPWGIPSEILVAKKIPAPKLYGDKSGDYFDRN